MINVDIQVGSKTIKFYVFPNIADAESRINSFAGYLRRMPQQHIDVVDPIFVVEKLYGGRPTGGGYSPPAQVESHWMGKQSRTGVSDDEIRELVLQARNHRGQQPGLIAITKDAFLRLDKIHFTIMHEIGHSVDHYLDLVPRGATLNDYGGIRYKKEIVGEYAVEAYARFIINPRRVCRDENIPAGENSGSCSRRVIGVIRRSSAFRELPNNWLPN